MQRIANGTQLASLPTPAAVTGTPGYFGATADGSPGPTRVGRDWLNAVQEEIMAVIVAGGLTPSPTTLTQLRDAINVLVASGISSPGQIGMFAMSSVPSGWLVMDGSAVSRTTYATLFAQISTTYGAGNGTTTFNLPDWRGIFPRGLDTGGAVDPGRALGTIQAHSVQSHNHASGVGLVAGTVAMYGDTPSDIVATGHQVGTQSANPTTQAYTSVGSPPKSTGAGAPVGNFATETRPINGAAVFAIRYR